MQRPEIRIIDNQSTQSNEHDINSYEADALLAKYGYKTGNIASPIPTPTDDRTFEDMIKQKELEQQRQIQRAQSARAITFDDGRTQYAETKWSSLEDSNIGVQITIVTDMKI